MSKWAIASLVDCELGVEIKDFDTLEEVVSHYFDRSDEAEAVMEAEQAVVFWDDHEFRIAPVKD